LVANGENSKRLQMEVADFRRLILESAKPFIILCSKFDNSLKRKSITTRVISDYDSEKRIEVYQD
jgi:hypothetical protein